LPVVDLADRHFQRILGARDRWHDRGGRHHHATQQTLHHRLPFLAVFFAPLVAAFLAAVLLFAAGFAFAALLPVRAVAFPRGGASLCLVSRISQYSQARATGPGARL